jgi:glycosidase
MSIRSLSTTLWFTLAALMLAACSAAPPERPTPQDPSMNPHEPRPYVRIEHPEWTRDAAIYQLNLRQFTAEGTLAAATAELPRIKALGTNIVWLMPIHPIGEKNRKGTLGSPYSVRDYFGVNPEFGTLEDLKSFVRRAHELGLYVILDWVANHTAWDNPLVDEHPDWYARDWKGDFRPTPWWDWSDIIDLDWGRPEVREYMTEAMTYWVREAGVDGFRCDVAWYVPLDFWTHLRTELERIKPVFMLAEAEFRDLHAEAFDATYAWSWYDTMGRIARGEHDLAPLFSYYANNERAWPRDALRMTFVSNHDKNAWEGTQFETFGAALEPAIVLSIVGEGIPLIYNGQEAGNPKRLAFFEKDPIDWRPHAIGDLYRDLLVLKKQNSALWNGRHGARMIRVWNDAPQEVLSFVRRNPENTVFAVLNFSPEARVVQFEERLHHGDYVDAFSGEPVRIDRDSVLSLDAWGYRILVR